MPIDFEAAFHALTGQSPFPWQKALYEMFAKGEIPSSCNLPTGLGKTSVIAIWLIALANHPDKMPRRLVYVVNRRTVVDQTTTEVEKCRANIEKAGLTERLKSLCALSLPKSKVNGAKDETEDPPLAISTLRGQFADNRAWSADPCRPAVICGTVDMIGSRLLFGGYGIGFKSKPLHAGFLGQDSLLVHDEAHLEPAFQHLIEDIEAEQRTGERTGELPWAKLRVMELSATSRGDGAFSLTDADRANPEVKKRIEAHKTLVFHSVQDEKKQLADMLGTLALAHKDSQQAILVFVRTVDDVEKLVAKLTKILPGKVQQLTGTLRGLERDRMADPRKSTGCRIFARFLRPPKPDAPEREKWKIEPEAGTVYLVCTSAAEVGVNISADHLVCDLSTFESMAQRLGRVNRFGDIEASRVDVVHPKTFGKEGSINALDERRTNTLRVLEQLNGNASPKALGDLRQADRLAAFSPPPTILPTSDILFDAWSLTTIRGKLPGRPPLDPYLHGISEWEPPQTHLAWRLEVDVIAGPLVAEYSPADLLEEYPVKSYELLADRSDRVFKHLSILAAKRPDDPVWLVDDDGTVEVLKLSEVADKEDKDRIEGKTVLLSPKTGGLRDGLLDGNAGPDEALDIADLWFDEKENQKRVRVWDISALPGMRLIRPRIDTKPDADDELDGGEATGRRYWCWFELPAAAESDGSRSAKAPVTWPHHTKDVAENARLIAAKSVLPEPMRKLLELAADFHDLGKKRELWQRSIGHRLPKNPKESDWLAKSGGAMAPVEITKYRHEFGSLLDAIRHPKFEGLQLDAQDFILNLIATHHGRGRPHFPEHESFDPNRPESESETIAVEVPRRFARLQRKFGRWGLAYLESLLRAADYAASANPSKLEETQ